MKLKIDHENIIEVPSDSVPFEISATEEIIDISAYPTIVLNCGKSWESKVAKAKEEADRRGAIIICFYNKGNQRCKKIITPEGFDNSSVINGRIRR